MRCVMPPRFAKRVFRFAGTSATVRIALLADHLADVFFCSLARRNPRQGQLSRLPLHQS
jgi:hypothetical protein